MAIRAPDGANNQANYWNPFGNHALRTIEIQKLNSHFEEISANAGT